MTGPRIDIALLAAGASRRMRGRDKTLELVEGTPLLRLLAKRCEASEATATHVILPPDMPARAKALTGLSVHHIIATDARCGMAASLKSAVKAAGAADALMIMLADMPQITTGHINRLIGEFISAPKPSIVRSTSEDGTAGHPVIFAARHFDALQNLSGDQGAKGLLETQHKNTIFVKLDGNAAVTDLDTPEDWVNWRAGTV